MVVRVLFSLEATELMDQTWLQVPREVSKLEKDYRALLLSTLDDMMGMMLSCDELEHRFAYRVCQTVLFSKSPI